MTPLMSAPFIQGLVSGELVGELQTPEQQDAADGNKRESTRKVDIRLPGKGNSKSDGARPVHLINSMIKWIRNSRLSIKNSRSGY